MAEAHWYVVHTYSGYENKVKANIDKTIENRHLEDQILEVRVPMQDVVEMKNGAKKSVSKKMFPGYVLINMVMNDDTWYVVRNTRGVTGFVGPGSKPVPLTDMEMKPLGIKTENVEVDFAEGDTVTVIGGAMFGARAYANNLSQEELLRALDYAHLHDKKIYLTVNTLMKQQELEDRLLPYLEPFYKAGLSAVIVQDFGAFEAIKEAFPGLHIHASTQMTVTGAAGAKLLKEAGASRVVTARELNLAEIKAIHDNCDIEIESFIHGALCYCYSGQCLLSSFQGGRSGNRGRCAQPCRLMYTPQTSDMPRTKGKGLRGDENRQKDSNGSAYLLSPKDMCGLPVLPDIIEAGVYSLKIKGRMKCQLCGRCNRHLQKIC